MSWTSIVKNLLTVCVLTSSAVSTVGSYSCEDFTCINGYCGSQTKACKASHGCFNRVQEFNSSSPSSSSIFQEKGCSTNKCNELAFSATLGHERKFEYKQHCCQTERCNKEDLKLSPLSSQTNGVECPACYNETHMSCDPVPLKCTGTQTKCVEVIGTVSSMYSSQLVIYAKGCATETACDMHKDVLNSVTIRTFCSSGSPPLTSISSVLTGLLLLKVVL